MMGQGPGTRDRGSGTPLARRDLLRLTPLAGLSLALAGCGYSLAGRGSFLPDYMRVIGVPMFGNRTPYSPLEQVLTEKVRVEFQSRGRYQVQPTDSGVDAVVRGDVTGVAAAPVGFNQSQQASRYRFTITVSVSLADVRQQKVLWENPALNFSDEYELASSASFAAGAAGFIDQERAAVDRLSSDFARSVVSAILEAF
ncbi:MAG: LPS assembly lipoprotein LptE [Vicinamibacterales bacterium]